MQQSIFVFRNEQFRRSSGKKVEKNIKLIFGFIEKPLITKGASREEIIQDQLVLAGDPANQNWLVREKDSGVFHYTQQYLEESNQSPTLMTVKKIMK